jgi:secreted trypsin-like serine protease
MIAMKAGTTSLSGCWRSRVEMLLWGMRVAALVVSALFAPAVTALGQTREEEEHCFNSDQEKVLMMAGAKDARLSDWPFIGALRQREDFNAEIFSCTGTFLSPTWFLTAGHCVATKDGAFSSTLSGGSLPRFSVSQSLDQRPRTVDKGAVSVKRIELAPGFMMGVRDNEEFADHDMALLKLTEPFKFASKNVYFPIAVTEHFERFWVKPGSCASVAGWGRTEESRVANIPMSTEPSRLQAMNVFIWDDSDCNDRKMWPNRQRYQFCAGYKILRKNSCHGDSGGPLIIRDSPTGFALVGILTAGNARSCPGERPNLYTRISDRNDWIHETMSKDPR